MSNYIAELCQFLDTGISPYHTVAHSAAYLEAHGFESLSLTAPFASVRRGGSYYIQHGTFLAAITVGEENFFRIAASHTDWPCLRIKPTPEQTAGGCLKLSVESYGGGIFSTWMDRPLSLAGPVLIDSGDPMKPELRLVAWEEPILTIPNLAIHMNREVNKGVPIKANVDMLPICRTIEEGFNKNNYLLNKLAEKVGVAPEAIVSFELHVYAMEKATLVGFEKDFLSSPRLDNICSVHSSLYGLTHSRGKGINLAVLYDNEEIGSNTRRGGDSQILNFILEKLCYALGLSHADFLDGCMKGMMLSCDGAHAAHPNHMEYADGPHAPIMNRGLVLKRSPRYSSDAETCAVVQALCRKENIPVQIFMNRADLAGGGTVGSMASSLLSMPAADVGIPMLAMHSACELMGAKDQESLCRLCQAFFEN
ncbi:MAG: M18 family aminopeptidase [Oscillospiraceae bacterium]|nr:M18 family aminopeptidase [Oscillospiraceae bacterium]